MIDLNKLFDQSKKIGRLRKIVFDLLKEHEAAGEDGLPTNSRFLFYELVQRKVLPKHGEQKGSRRADQNLHDATTHLREHGLVPWEWIEDETRWLEDYTGCRNIKEGAQSAIAGLWLDPWGGRPPMLLCESRSAAGVLRNLAQQYSTKLAPTNGQCGGFLRTNIAPQLKPGDTVLYVGDGDLQGGQIEANTRRVLERLVGGKLNWTRIALTEKQIDRYDLRPLQIMKVDHRYNPSHPNYRGPAIEVETLKQQVLVQIVRDALDALLPEKLEDVLEREGRQRRSILARLKGGR
jgi:hypothetical protein